MGALVAAALLVAYLLRRNLTEQQHQTQVIHNDICAQTAAFLAGRVRQELAAAVLDALERMNHVDPAQYRLANVAPVFTAGLGRYPYVDRFFLWSRQAPREYRDQVLFFRTTPAEGPRDIAIRGTDGTSLGSLYADADSGRDFLQAALAAENGGRTFVLIERMHNGVPFHVVIHQWGAVLPSREIVGIIGYTVNLSKVRQHTLEQLVTAAVHGVLAQQSRSVQLQFSAFDESEHLVFGVPPKADVPSASAPIVLSFFPAEIPRAWVVDRITPLRWRLVVSAPSPEESPATEQYLFVAVMLLIFTAIGCAAAVNRQASRLSQMHVDFVTNVSHQLRTPLSLLAAASETLGLERVRTPQKIAQYAAVLHSQTARLTRLVEQVLRFSRIESGADLYELQRIDLASLVRGIVDRVMTPPGGPILRFEGPAERIGVWVDPIAIEEVLTNLIDNAVKYSSAAPEVLVRVTSSGGEAVVSVIDRGAGIDAADLPHVFDKFYRGRTAGSASTGFGLGLAIVQEIVKAHRGRVQVESQLSRGSEFRVFLPADAGA